MKNLSTILLLCISLIFMSCNNDDDNQSPGDPVEDFTLPNTVIYQSTSNVEFMLWVGGEEVDTEGLSPNDILPTDFESSVDFTTYMFTFYPDTLETQTPDSTSRVNYWFSNDSLYIKIPNPFFEIAGPPFIETYAGYGSPFALNIEIGSLYMASFNNNIGQRASYTDYSYYTFGNSVDLHSFSDPSQMNENDTVMIFNQRFLYN